MGIYRAKCIKDNTIVNAFDSFLTQRGIESNNGASDVLEVFTIYGRDGSSAIDNELSRILIKFDLDEFQNKISQGVFDPLNSKFYLKMFNIAHGETLPKNYEIEIAPLVSDWEEGIGNDMENYQDKGGSCWINSADGVAWVNAGGDYNSGYLVDYEFVEGNEELIVDISNIVRAWLDGSLVNNGLIIKSKYENLEKTFYTKRFRGKNVDDFLRKPTIEVQYEEDPSIYFYQIPTYSDDRREDFYLASPLANPADYTNRIYFTNVIRGNIQDVPNNTANPVSMVVKIYNEDKNICLSGLTPYNVTRLTTGVYYSDIVLEDSINMTDVVHDIWYESADPLAKKIYEGTITVNRFEDDTNNIKYVERVEEKYVINIKDLQYSYLPSEIVKFRLFVRKKDWKPNKYFRYHTDYVDEDVVIIEEMYYKVIRLIDERVVIDYSHREPIKFSQVGYDQISNWFKLDMGLFQDEYMYGIKFLYKTGDSYIEYPEVFKFRVTNREIVVD